MKCEAMYEKRSEYGISEMCKALGMSRSTYYNWIKRKLRIEEKAKTRIESINIIRRIFEENKKSYGYRRMQLALAEEKIELSIYKVRKTMREIGLYPIVVKKYKPYPNKRSDGRYSENILRQKFKVEEPNRVWAGDITYIKTKLGGVYLSVVMDLFNREIIGYSISKTVDTDLVRRALGNALHNKEENQSIMFHKRKNVSIEENTVQWKKLKAICLII